MAMPWFRFYSEALGDRKIDAIRRTTQQPKALIIGCWVTVLALANDSPMRGTLLWSEDTPMSLDDLRTEMDLEQDMFESIMEQFVRFGMVCVDGGLISVTKWDTRQFSSDNSTDRVQKYRERRKQAGLPAATTYDTGKVLERFDNRCVYCGRDTSLVVDHMIPVSMGGTDHELNLVAACRTCSNGKAGKTPEEAQYTFASKLAREQYASYLFITDRPEQECNGDVTPPVTEGVTGPVTPCNGHVTVACNVAETPQNQNQIHIQNIPRTGARKNERHRQGVANALAAFEKRTGAVVGALTKLPTEHAAILQEYYRLAGTGGPPIGNNRIKRHAAAAKDIYTEVGDSRKAVAAVTEFFMRRAEGRDGYGFTINGPWSVVDTVIRIAAETSVKREQQDTVTIDDLKNTPGWMND